MKQNIFMLIAFLLMLGCSSDKSPVTSTVHPEGWADASSNNFHGAKVQQVGYPSCQSCHGADLKGGRSGISCFQANCHLSYPRSENLIRNIHEGADLGR